MTPSTDQQERICTTCNNMLLIDPTGLQSGWYCCDEYFCSQVCLDKSFDGYEFKWAEHYDDEGDCYWTEWEQEAEL